MQVWNISDKETERLKLLGLTGVSVNVNGELLKPGEGPRFVPPHMRAELSSLLRNGILTETDPTPPPPAQGPTAEEPAATKKADVQEAPPEPPPADASAPDAPPLFEDSPRARRGR